MATLIDSVGTQHYANKMVLAENRKVGSKSLPTALADVDKLIDEMEGLFDGEYGSSLDMKLENNENVFPVGTGSGVDKKSEVENSFTDVEVFGNSMVNMSSTKETLNKTNAHFFDVLLCETSFLKPDTKYSIRYLFECNIDFTFSRCYVGYGPTANIMTVASSITFTARKGANTLNFAIPGSELQRVIEEGHKFFYIRVFIDDKKLEKTHSTKDVMLIEGDYTNKPLPQYFEGLRSAGEKESKNEIEILSINKNLIVDSEFENKNKNWSISRGTIVEGYNGWNGYQVKHDGSDASYSDILQQRLFDRSSNFNRIAPGAWYTLSFFAKGSGFKSYIYPGIIDSSVKGIVNGVETALAGDGDYRHRLTEEWQKFTYTFKTSSTLHYTRFSHNFLLRAFNGDYGVVSNILLEPGKTATDYSTHLVDKKKMTIAEPLRGLPSGVRDSIEKINGEWKLIRRCGQANFNGSEAGWGYRTELENGYTRYSNVTALKFLNSELICNSFRQRNPETPAKGISLQPSNGAVHIVIQESTLDTPDVNGLQNFLSKNPVSLVFLLETPIIESIDEVTLQCWKNGTILIEEPVPVKTRHTVALNKPAQIKRNIEELTSLRSRVLTLEEQYDQVALEQAHKLDLLNHSFELDYNI